VGALFSDSIFSVKAKNLSNGHTVSKKNSRITINDHSADKEIRQSLI